ncbi:hypothetical protein QYE76_037200 [Lolium multiflorum]|uniref:RNase H type-1 domain-containing protein n=1 Tax=Lolium multiflorum TaxID=4521 RepID=A0AAD8VDW6_LOLMU|nr:hypothetical protein QYE76_037200 [Lolium multiflorum]
MADKPVTYEELTEDHKKNYDELKSQFEADLGSFERTRSHGIRWKGFSPEGVLDGVDLSLPSEERTRALRQEVNYMVAHSLHRHFESLVNSLERIAVRVIQEIMKHQYSLSGPVLGTHQGEIPLYTRPPLPFALARAHASPAYVVYKRRGETVSEYIQRFRTVRNRCYSVRLNEKEVVELAALGLAAPLKDLALQTEYNSLAHMIQKLTLYEQRHPELYQDKFVKRPIALVETADVEDSEDQEVAVAEWTRGAVPVSCKWVKPQGPARGFDFDISKVEQIFDLLLKEKQLKLPEGHKFPTMQEMNGRPYYKWHHSFTHTTNDCKELRPVHHHGGDKEEDGHFHGKDKEEVGLCDRTRYDDKRYITEQQPAKAVKGQALADLIAERINTDIAALSGMEMLLEAGAEAVELFGDSKLVISQLTEEYKCESESLFPLWMQCRELMAQFKYINFNWIPRSQNAEANDLAQMASGYKDVADGADVQNDLTSEEYAALMSDSIEDVTELRLWSLEKIKENKAKVARAYNKKVRPKEFHVGDLVWEAVLPLGTKDAVYGKWSPNWHGPYRVDQVLKGNAYMLEQLDGVKFLVAVNGQHLKKYFPSMWDDGQ